MSRLPPSPSASRRGDPRGSGWRGPAWRGGRCGAVSGRRRPARWQPREDPSEEAEEGWGAEKQVRERVLTTWRPSRARGEPAGRGARGSSPQRPQPSAPGLTPSPPFLGAKYVHAKVNSLPATHKLRMTCLAGLPYMESAVFQSRLPFAKFTGRKTPCMRKGEKERAPASLPPPSPHIVL